MDPDCPPDCNEALEDLERYLDGELGPERLDGIRDHLARCFPCADRAEFEEQLRAVVRRGCAERAPDRLVVAVRRRLDIHVEGPRT